MWLLCQIISYLEADSYTSAIRNAISLGGDADTMACMAGGIAVVVKKWSCVIGTALLPDMDDFTIVGCMNTSVRDNELYLKAL